MRRIARSMVAAHQQRVGGYVLPTIRRRVTTGHFLAAVIACAVSAAKRSRIASSTRSTVPIGVDGGALIASARLGCRVSRQTASTAVGHSPVSNETHASALPSAHTQVVISDATRDSRVSIAGSRSRLTVVVSARRCVARRNSEQRGTGSRATPCASSSRSMMSARSATH